MVLGKMEKSPGYLRRKEQRGKEFRYLRGKENTEGKEILSIIGEDEVKIEDVDVVTLSPHLSFSLSTGNRQGNWDTGGATPYTSIHVCVHGLAWHSRTGQTK